jgi:ATPase family associated with various cellular activities (AAA)
MRLNETGHLGQKNCVSPAPGVAGLVVNKKSPFYHVFNFMAQEYGNDLDKMLQRINGMLALGVASKFIKNTKIRKGLQISQTALSVGLFTTEFMMHVKNYVRQLKQEKITTYNQQLVRACQILEITEDNPYYGDLPVTEVNVGNEVTQWILSHPKTNRFKILKYYNMITLQEICELDLSDATVVIDVGILIEKDNIKFLWIIDLRIVSGFFYVKNSMLTSERLDDDIKENFRKSVLAEYVASLDIVNNALFFDQFGGVVARPRHKISEKINQYDVDQLVLEIREVLDKKRRRAFAFVGRQGVGKSAILHKIEEQITEYMVIHLTPDDFTIQNLRDRFSLIKSFQPAIVMIEDLDSCGLREKDRLTGAFLDCIDEINRDLNIVILVTINDTSSVHYTILNRPGRFDRIFEIESPKSVKEIYEIVLSKINAIKENYCDDDLKHILKPCRKLDQVFRKCLSLKFTQAEITNAVVEQAFIDINIAKLKWSKITNNIFAGYIFEAIEKHMKTKDAIKKCNFNNKNPETDEIEFVGAEPAKFLKGVKYV